MMQWLNSNLALGDNYQAAESRGEERRELMVKFNTLQQRARNNYCIPKKIASVSRERIEEVFTWNNEIMDEVMGAERAQALRDSGQIEWKPCPITGSTEEHMKVWFFLHVLESMFKELKKRIIKQYLSELFEQTLWTEIFEHTWKKMSNIFDKVLRNSNEKIFLTTFQCIFRPQSSSAEAIQLG